MAQLFQNNAFGSLGATLSAVSASLTLATGHGARFPSPTGGDHFLLTLVGLDGNGNENAWEIVRVNARASDTLTIVRAQESTTAALWASGTRVELRATAGAFANYAQLVSPTFTGTVTTPNLAFNTAGGKITGDFSNATIANRVMVQSSTTNGNTQLGLVPNGTAVNSAFFAHNASDPTNSSTAVMRVNASEMALISGITGTGSYLPMSLWTSNTERMRIDTNGRVGIGVTPAASQGVLQVFGTGITGGSPSTTGSTDANQIAEIGAGSVQLSFGAYANGDAWIQQRSASNFATNYGIGINPNGGRVFVGGGFQEARSAMGANNIDLSAGNFFTKTISGATTFTVSNVPATGIAASFILDLTNGGSGTITWWSGMKWAGGTAPTLTASGRDVLGFYTHDGGTTWTGLLMAKDAK